MSFAATCAEELRATLSQLDKLAPSHKDPHRYHESKSDIAHRIRRVAELLEGDFTIVEPEARPRPAPRSRRPHTIKSASGNVIQVDFKARRAVTK